MTMLRLKLVRVEPRHKAALKQGRVHLQELLGATIPDGWPQFPEAFELGVEDEAACELWPSYFFVCTTQGALVGNGGFAAPPNDSGAVEIGYEIAPPSQNQGYATSAASLLKALAFSRPMVTELVAHTLAEHNASNAVLRKIGMTMVAELANDEVGKVWKWSVRRTA